MIRLIVQSVKEDRYCQRPGHLDTSYRVFEVDSPAFEELIKAGGSLTLIGLEVTEDEFALPLAAPASTPPALPALHVISGGGAPVPALPAVGATGSDGVPAPGASSAIATRAMPKEGDAMRARYGRWQWRRRLGLKPYPNPALAGPPGVIKLPG